MAEVPETKPRFKDSLKGVLEWLHHAYWIREFLVSSGIVGVATKWLVKHSYLPQIYQWPAAVLAIGIVMYLIAIIRGWQSKTKQVGKPQSGISQLANTSTDVLPAGTDIKEFFRHAYRSTQEDEIRKNFRLLAQAEQPNDHEEFYLKFIGVGFMATFFDSIWWPMFRSQLLVLQR